QALREGQAQRFERLGDVHGREEIALDVEQAVDVGLGKDVRRGMAHQPGEDLLGREHDRERGYAAADGHVCSLPETEGEAGWNEPGEDVTEDVGRPRGGGGRRAGGWRDHGHAGSVPVRSGTWSVDARRPGL